MGRWLGTPDLPTWFTSKWPAYTWAMVFTVLGAGIASIIFRHEVNVEKHDQTWLESSSRDLEPIREHPFSASIPAWAKPELLAVLLIAATSIFLFGWLW